MGRFYWLDEGSDAEACYDKKHLQIWILGQFSTYEREGGWNHWGIFGRRGPTVEFECCYWRWSVWDPIPPRPDIDWDPYWSDDDMSKEHMVHCLYLEAKEDVSTRMSVRSYG